MYNISDLVVAISSFFVIYNSYLIVDKIIPRRYKKVLYNNSIFFIDFCIFICDNNPLCLEFNDKIVEEVVKVEVEELAVVTKKIETKYEDKYLEKFKAFRNEFCFNLEEMDEEQKEYERIKQQIEKTKSDIILEIQGKLFKINEIQENGNITNDTDKHYTENINNIGKSQLIEYFDLQEDDDIDFEELEKIDEDNSIIHINVHVINCDEKLAVAADDIKDMKKDSSKFSKTLSELV